MKKLILLVSVSMIAGALAAQVISSALNFNARAQLTGGTHRLVLIADPTTLKGGKILLDEKYAKKGALSFVNASVSVKVK